MSEAGAFGPRKSASGFLVVLFPSSCISLRFLHHVCASPPHAPARQCTYLAFRIVWLCIQVVNSVAATWRSVDHEAVAEGHWRVGLANALDGSEDDKLRGDAKDIFFKFDAATMRQEVLSWACAGAEAGTLAWENIYDYIVHPADAGVLQEGEELDEHDEAPPLDGVAMDEETAGHNREADLLADWAGGGDDNRMCALVPLEEGDDAVLALAAEEQAQRLCMLTKVANAAAVAKLPQVAWHCARERSRIEKGWAADSPASAANNAILRRYLENRMREEQKKMAKVQQTGRQRAANVRRVKSLWKLRKLRKAELLEKNNKRKCELSKLPKRFTAAVCGQDKDAGGGRDAMNARVAVMERLRLRSPPLPCWLSEEWEPIRDWYCKSMAERHKKAVGVAFLKDVNEVIDALGDCILPGENGAPCKKPKKDGNAKAFERFVLWLREKMPQPGRFVVV